MYRGCTIAVVVPAYNEEGFVGEVIDTLPDFVDRAYVVDDASTDGTWAEIREHAANANRAAGEQSRDGVDPSDDGRVVPIRHDDNRGVGGAIVTGYRRALADGMDVTAVMNGDGQMDPAILDCIVDPVATGRAGYAKGERLADGERRAAMSRWRLFGNALLTGLTRVATGYWTVTDPQNGYTAISREALAAVDLDSRYEGYGFCNDLLAALGRAGVRVADVPMTAVYGDEASGIRYSRFVPGLSSLLLVAFLRRLWSSYVVRELHPLVALYGLGAVGLLAGVLGVVGAGVAAAAGAEQVAVGGGLAAALAGLYGAGLVALGATFDRRAAEGRVVRVDEGDPSEPASDGAANEHAPRVEVRTDGAGGDEEVTDP